MQLPIKIILEVYTNVLVVEASKSPPLCRANLQALRWARFSQSYLY